MKLINAILLTLFSLQLLASDMSHTEDYDSAYEEKADGSIVYIGKCSVHQDYENNKYSISSTLVNYFEPSSLSDREFNKKMRKIEKELIIAAGRGDNEFLKNADDITIEKIKLSNKNDLDLDLDLDLYRLNVGVGGGNGMYLIFNRSVQNNQPHFEFLAEIFDGDVEYCDQKVWEN